MEPTVRAADMLEKQGIAFAEHEPLSGHTTFQIGGPARLFCRPDTPEKVAAALAIARENALPHYIMGRGSNLLFCDEGYAGLIIKPELEAVQVEGTRVTAGAGAALSAVCTAALQAGLAGLEFAYGIPGGVGGAVYMNAGAFEGEVCQVLGNITYLDEAGARQRRPAAELGLSYRSSVFQQKPWCILQAEFLLQAGDPAAIGRRMEDYMARRREKQPLDLPSAGSAFKRPEGAFAGALIDGCGLRGHRVGGAAIDQKHCGFIVNLGGATCADVLALADEVVAIVREKTGYVLEKEIRVVGAAESL